jgi:hypothetical protein|tara:strand:+ start:482 stop:886 length:405 start_codon:yes stop_codon:yes gene_type:complete
MELITKRYFKIEEANSLIPKLSKILIQIMKINNHLSMINSISVDYEDELKSIKNDIVVNKNFHRLYYNLYKKIEMLTNLGCIVKDADLGIVDFYSMLEGREILLCWKLGEKEIKFWHYADESYAGRKSIDMLKE